MNSDYAYKDSVEDLRNKFPNLTINYTNRLLRLTLNALLKTYLLSITDNNKDRVIKENEVRAITTMTVTNDIITFTDSADDYDNLLELCVALQNLS